MLVEMLGFIDAENIEERGKDSYHCHIKDASNEQTEEHLSDHMQGMSGKGTIV